MNIYTRRDTIVQFHHTYSFPDAMYEVLILPHEKIQIQVLYTRLCEFYRVNDLKAFSFIISVGVSGLQYNFYHVGPIAPIIDVYRTLPPSTIIHQNSKTLSAFFLFLLLLSLVLVYYIILNPSSTFFTILN